MDEIIATGGPLDTRLQGQPRISDKDVGTLDNRRAEPFFCFLRRLIFKLSLSGGF
jgi:hypothetical protein